MDLIGRSETTFNQFAFVWGDKFLMPISLYTTKSTLHTVFCTSYDTLAEGIDNDIILHYIMMITNAETRLHTCRGTTL